MYHICVIYVPYMTHMYSLYGWLVNGRKGGEKEIELSYLTGGLASLPNCYIRQVNPSQASLRMGSAHEGEEGRI